MSLAAAEQDADTWVVPDWPAPPGVHAVTTTRRGPGRSLAPFDRFNLGSRCGDDAALVQANRTALVAALGLRQPPRWLRQVHGVAVCDADVDDRAAIDGTQTALGSVVRAGPMFDAAPPTEPEADAGVSHQPGRVLAILTADCLPVLFAARDGSAIGAAHAGWRGLCAGVVERCVAGLRRAPAELQVWLGPAIGASVYEVGAEVRSAFLAVDPEAAVAFVDTRPGHWRCDLYLLARQRLARLGVDRIYGGGLCTFSDATRFYSHRREQPTGRMASVIWRE